MKSKKITCFSNQRNEISIVIEYKHTGFDLLKSMNKKEAISFADNLKKEIDKID